MKHLFVALAIAAGMLLPTEVYCTSSASRLISATRKLAEQGNAKVQFYLGEAYCYGIIVRQDYNEAMKWFKLAAAQGYALAQYNIGVMYDNGKGVRQNKQLAKEWFGKACDNGLQMGCDNYRIFNEQGY